uniref:Uncharacterized protein n=1 Tax=Anguilla anguilla TaxID=7936 RepID=A0A0E9Q627_ANGAN
MKSHAHHRIQSYEVHCDVFMYLFMNLYMDRPSCSISSFTCD